MCDANGLIERKQQKRVKRRLHPFVKSLGHRGEITILLSIFVQRQFIFADLRCLTFQCFQTKYCCSSSPRLSFEGLTALWPNKRKASSQQRTRAGQNSIHTPCMTVWMMISLLKTPWSYLIRVCVWLCPTLHRTQHVHCEVPALPHLLLSAMIPLVIVDNSTMRPCILAPCAI